MILITKLQNIIELNMQMNSDQCTVDVYIPNGDYFSPLSLHFYSKYAKMILFAQACSDTEILCFFTQFLEVKDILNLALVNPKMHQLIYGTENLELRIIKAKLNYFENRVNKGNFNWNDYQIERWYSQSLSLKVDVGRFSKSSTNRMNFAEAIFKKNPNKRVRENTNLQNRSRRLEELKKANNIKKYPRDPPKINTYRQKPLQQDQIDYDKTLRIPREKVIHFNQQAQKRRYKQSQSLKTTNQQMMNREKTESDKMQQLKTIKQEDQEIDGVLRGIKIPRVMRHREEDIVIKRQTFIDRLRDNFLRKLGTK